MEISQKQKQEQRLALTPQMLTAITILQLSGTDLMEFLSEEAQSNPALDSDEVLQQTQRMSEAMELVRLTPYIDRNQDDTLSQSDETGWEQPLESPTSFADHLIEQIQLLKLSREVRDSAILIAQSLDERGYLNPEDESSLAALPGYGAGLRVVQGLEPSGVGARSLSECLIIQIRNLGIADGTLEQILTYDLELLAAGQFDLLSERYGVTTAGDYLELVRTLNPKPAGAYTDTAAPFYVIPDLAFEIRDGAVKVTLNNALTPKLSVSSRFLALLENLDEAQKPLYTQYVRRLTGIIEAVEKRNRTLLSIGERIAFHQSEFLLGRTPYRRPLRMSGVAQEIGLNVSTVSRAVRDKYAEINGRVVPLRLFFGPGYEKGGQAFTKAEVTDRIVTLIQGEDPATPLSDEKLARLLADSGIPIKRRTVAKYRDEQNIPVSYERHKKSGKS